MNPLLYWGTTILALNRVCNPWRDELTESDLGDQNIIVTEKSTCECGLRSAAKCVC